MLLTNAYKHLRIKCIYTRNTHMPTNAHTHTQWHQGETRVRQDWLSLPVAPESILIFPTLLSLHTSLVSLSLSSSPKDASYFSFLPFFLPFCPLLKPHLFFPKSTLSVAPVFLFFSASTTLSLLSALNGADLNVGKLTSAQQWNNKTHLQGSMDTHCCRGLIYVHAFAPLTLFSSLSQDVGLIILCIWHKTALSYKAPPATIVLPLSVNHTLCQYLRPIPSTYKLL